jgi:hypothetical protein
MDRRIFLKSLLGVAGAAAVAGVLSSQAEASPLLAELQAMDAKGANPLTAAPVAGDLPAEGATEAQYNYRRRPASRRRYVRPMYRRPMYSRPMRRCRTVVNRFGRLVRRCWVG